jgi:hypothetical protein
VEVVAVELVGLVGAIDLLDHRAAAPLNAPAARVGGLL